MLQPLLEPKDCPNYATCGSAAELTPEEEVELIRVRELQLQEEQQHWERIQERFRVSRRSAAVAMLMQRGCSQPLENFGIDDAITAIENQLQTLRSHLEHYHQTYIAPDHCEAHRYNVKRPYGTYWYNKLTSPQAVFEPAAETENVKVIHLSHNDDPRNLEGRLGIERRNRLHHLQTQLQGTAAALEQAIALLSEPLPTVLAEDNSLDS